MLRSRRSRSTDRGFSLPELMVAVLIIGVLSALAMAAFRAVTLRAADDAAEAELAAVVRQAHTFALGRGDATITDADFERALADTAAAAEQTSSNGPRWVAVADPVGDNDPAVRELAAPAPGELRVAFSAGYRAAAAVVHVRDQRVAIAHVAAGGVAVVRSVDLDDDPAFEPTAGAAMRLLSNATPAIAFGSPPPGASSDGTATAQPPAGIATEFTFAAAGDDAGAIFYLGTAGRTATTFTNPADDQVVTTSASGTASGSPRDVLDRDATSTFTTSADERSSWTLDLTDRASLAPTTVAVHGLTDPTGVTLHGSRDGTTFTELQTSTATVDTVTQVIVDPPQDGQVAPAWRFVRLELTATSASPVSLAFADVELYGTLYEPELLPAAPPADLQAGLVDGTVQLSWDPVPGASGYQVDRDGTQIATIDTVAYTDAPAAGQHSYTVRAVFPDREARSASVEVSTDPNAGPVADVVWDADDLTLVDGAAVEAWIDRHHGLRLQRPSSAVRYSVAGGPAGHAAVRFSGTRPLEAGVADVLTGPAFTYIAVVRWDGGNGGIAGVGDRAWMVRGEEGTDAHQLRVAGNVVATDTSTWTRDAWQVVAVRYDGTTVTTWSGQSSAAANAPAAAATDGVLTVGAAGAARLDGAVTYLAMSGSAWADADVAAAIAELTATYELVP